MGEWFANVWNGIVEYAPQIAALFSTVAASIGIPNIIGYFKQKAKINELNKATNDLIVVTNDINKNVDVKNLTEQYKVLAEAVLKLKEELDEVKDVNDRSICKINLLLEGLTKVYDYSIENPEIKNFVLTILGNARYADETNSIAALKEELEALKKEMIQKTQELAEDVAETVKKVDAKVETKTKSNATRG